MRVMTSVASATFDLMEAVRFSVLECLVTRVARCVLQSCTQHELAHEKALSQKYKRYWASVVCCCDSKATLFKDALRIDVAKPMIKAL